MFKLTDKDIKKVIKVYSVYTKNLYKDIENVLKGPS